MDSTNLFLMTFTVMFAVVGIIVYNIDFSKWENKHSHD